MTLLEPLITNQVYNIILGLIGVVFIAVFFFYAYRTFKRIKTRQSGIIASISLIISVIILGLIVIAQLEYQHRLDDAPSNTAVIEKAEKVNEKGHDRYYKLKLYNHDQHYNVTAQRQLKNNDLIHYKDAGRGIVFEPSDTNRKDVLTNKHFHKNITKGWIDSDDFTDRDYSNIQMVIPQKYDVSDFNQKNIKIKIVGKSDSTRETIDVTDDYENLSTVDNNDEHQINFKATNFQEVKQAIKDYDKIKLYLD